MQILLCDFNTKDGTSCLPFSRHGEYHCYKILWREWYSCFCLPLLPWCLLRRLAQLKAVSAVLVRWIVFEFYMDEHSTMPNCVHTPFCLNVNWCQQKYYTPYLWVNALSLSNQWRLFDCHVAQFRCVMMYLIKCSFSTPDIAVFALGLTSSSLFEPMNQRYYESEVVTLCYSNEIKICNPYVR